MEARWRIVTTSIGLLILRVGMGGFLLTHGWGKLQLVLAGDFEKFGDPIGLGKGLSLVLVMMAEFICALLVMVGFATRFAAVPIVFSMGVAVFVAHSQDPWAKKEPAPLYLIPFLTLIFTGAGKFSIDGLIWRRKRV